MFILFRLLKNPAEISSTIDEFIQQGAQRILLTALQSEVDDYIQCRKSEQDENGHTLVVGNGSSQERTIQSGVGQLKLKTPRVNDKRDGYCPSPHETTRKRMAP